MADAKIANGDLGSQMSEVPLVIKNTSMFLTLHVPDVMIKYGKKKSQR